MRVSNPSGKKGDFNSPKSLKNSRKPVGFRSYKKQIVIVVEGTKTEDGYFRSLAQDLHLQTVKVTVHNSKMKTTPKQIYEKAKSKREELRSLGLWDEEDDEVWCVFDT